MKTIWKFELQVIGVQYVDMPKDAVILTAQIQNGKPTIWALVDPKVEEVEKRCILTFGTGNPILDYELTVNSKFISTYQVEPIGFVGHVFEKIL